MPTQRSLAIAAVAGSMATAALGQDAGFELRVPGDVTPANPSILIDVWAYFPVEDYALSGARYSLHASSAGFAWPDCFSVLHHCGIGSEEPTRVGGIVQGQVHFPPPILADPTNPLSMLRVTWRTDDLTPRVVDLWTETTDFEVYIEKETTASASRMDRLVEGAARIRVLDRECYADCDASGDLDFIDFLCFQNLFAAGDPLADCDLDGQLDFFDFLCFQNEFVAGCP